MKIKIWFNDFSISEEASIEDAKETILEAFAEGVLVDYIEDDEGNLYSCVWSLELQKES
jgi:hypothetical protein